MNSNPNSNAELNKKLLIAVIVLSAIVLLGAGVLIGRLSSSPSSAEPEQALQDTISAQVQAAVAAVEAKKEETKKVEEKKEKLYGYPPSFYVKKQHYWVSWRDAMHPIRIYTSGSVRLDKAHTDTNWLEEERLERGGSEFHVKKNDERRSRKSKLFLRDNRGRRITIYVTQGGKP